MPELNEANVRHLLRRTEFVDRQARVDTLLGLGTIDAAVANVMTVDSSPPALVLGTSSNSYEQGVALSYSWMDRMARAPRPFGERMALFWHGHLCTELAKIRSGEPMRDQIDLFRRTGVNGSVGQLMKDMAIQPAMLRYLDNDQNFASSPNQNFARELMELFILGVGNYTEDDVEASTAAWTGHGDVDYDGPGRHQFSAARHEDASQPFLGKLINRIGGEFGSQQDLRRFVGFQMIDVMLWLDQTYFDPLGNVYQTRYAVDGGITSGGRDSNLVAAEFLSLKLWQEFGEAESRAVPAGVLGAMTSALRTSGFGIRAWITAMLTHDDFYAPPTKVGLVRQPVDYAVGLGVATGLRAADSAPTWLMERTGQRLLYPPNVSGWKPNGYWVNATAMEARNSLAQRCQWQLIDATWDGDNGYITLPGGRLDKDQLDTLTGTELVARVLSLTDLRLSPAATARIATHVDGVEPLQRLDALLLVLLAPEMHIA